MFLIIVLKICQMVTKINHDYKQVLEICCVVNVFLGIFRNTWRQHCLLKAILLGDYSELNFIQLFCFVIALIFSCVQRNRALIKVVSSIMESESYLKLIVYLFVRQEIKLLTLFSWKLWNFRNYFEKLW